MRNTLLFDRDIADFSDSLTETDSGFWVSESLGQEVSYPEEHHRILIDHQETSFWYLHRSLCLSELLRQFPSDSILDVGGSNGLLTRKLNEIAPAGLLEPGESAALNAHKLGIAPVINSTFQEAGFKENCISAIGLFDVLEHIESDESFLRDIHYSLKQNGRLYITVPAFMSLWSRFDKSVGHFRRYTRKRLENDLRSAGFEVEYFTYLFSILVIPMWLVRKSQQLLGLNPVNQKVHKRKDSFSGKLLGLFLKVELWAIRKRITIPIGSSCLCVLKKKQT